MALGALEVMAFRSIDEIDVCVFDAYGTLFDIRADSLRDKEQLGEKWKLLSDRWREKQLQYTWLRTITRDHVDFWRVTEDALDYAMTSVAIEDHNLRNDLLDLYRSAVIYPDVKETLNWLRSNGMTCAILSNGSPKMLDEALTNTRLHDYFGVVLSAEEVGYFKPHPAVYELAVSRLGVARDRILFISSNAWDAFSAKAYGFKVVWCNRNAGPEERIPGLPDAVIESLAELSTSFGPPCLGRE